VRCEVKNIKKIVFENCISENYTYSIYSYFNPGYFSPQGLKKCQLGLLQYFRHRRFFSYKNFKRTNLKIYFKSSKFDVLRSFPLSKCFEASSKFFHLKRSKFFNFENPKILLSKLLVFQIHQEQ